MADILPAVTVQPEETAADLELVRFDVQRISQLEMGHWSTNSARDCELCSNVRLKKRQKLLEKDDLQIGKHGQAAPLGQPISARAAKICSCRGALTGAGVRERGSPDLRAGPGHLA